MHSPEKIAGGQDNAGGGSDGDYFVLLEGANENQCFTYKTGQAGQPQGSKEGQAGVAGINRHGLGQTAEAINIAMVCPIINHSHQQKEHGGDSAVVEHLQHRSVYRRGIAEY